jgi:thiol-disulfide isomerase/thioredoxin
VAYVCLATWCVALAGCGTLGKKAPLKPKEPSRQSADASSSTPSDGAAATPVERVSSLGLGGLLAGRVLDSYDRPPPPTYIQVLPAQDGRDSKSPSLEVATDNQGYFTIQGLQAGQHYQLIARTRDGEPKLAGTTWATPPNPRILIFVSQDFATPNTPSPPAPPAVPGRKPASSAAPPTGAGTPAHGAGDMNRDPAKPPNHSVPAPGGADIGPPTRLRNPVAPPGDPSSVAPLPRTEIRTEDIVDALDSRVNTPPVINIPNQADPGQPSPAVLPPTPAPLLPEPAAQVPSCVLTGRQLHNFVLYDLNARPWEYRNHRGRMVLLVFWETACLPCRAAIPHLKILQDRYGPSGLEIIAIAYEDGSLPEQIRKLQGVRERLDINYRLLVGGEVASCPVRTQFGVNAFPTLVLLDEGNRIIWRQQGLDAAQLQQLETLVRLQLHAR